MLVSRTLAGVRQASRVAFATIVILVAFGCGGGGNSSTESTGSNNPPQSNPSPAIGSISPSTATAGATTLTITITGSGFIQGSTASWNQTSLTTTYVSATQLTVSLPAADLSSGGSDQITVTNPTPGGGTSSPTTFTVDNPVPAVTALSPTSIVVGSAPPVLTVTGTGFGPSSVIQINGTSRTTTYVSGTSLTTPLNLADVASLGTLQVTVVTGGPGGGSSPTSALQISNPPPPTLTSVSPTSIYVNSPATLTTIRGSGFSSSTIVQVNGNGVTVNGVSPIALSFTVPASDLTSVGSLTVTTINAGTSASNSLVISVTAPPAPTLTFLSPSSAAVGGSGFTLTLTGSNFAASSVVQWDGSPRPTTYVNSSELAAVIPATDIQVLGTSTIDVQTPAPGGGVSTSFPFATYVGLAANDILYNPTTKLLYASVPSSAGPAFGNSIVPVDPYTGVIGTPIWVGSEPGRMALSSDGSTIWVMLNAAAAVREVNVTAQTAGLQFSLGGGAGLYSPPLMATALAVMPGQPNTVAVATTTDLYNNDGGLKIYDSGIARPNIGLFPACCGSIEGLAFDSTGANLYQAGGGYGLATVNGSGIASDTELNSNVNSNDLQVDDGRAYLTDGIVLDANTGNQLGVFSIAPNQNASGPVVPDSSLGEALVLTGGNTTSIYAYNLNTFNLIGSFSVPGASTFTPGTTQRMTRWGQDGLAFNTGTQLFIVRSTLVRDLSTSLADLSVSATAPTSGIPGSTLTYTLTVSNSGPLAATPATLIDDIPVGSSFQSATANQGTCSGGAIVYCNLGNLNSGSSATVQITITLLSPGTLTNTASVAAPQGDPNTANNTVTSATTVTGTAFGIVPAITSISPSFVQAGTQSFKLTVNGSGFTPNFTVQMNSTPLSTTFVNPSQLTTSVSASSVASLGWAWINVATPAPGGGVSSNLPLTVYQVVSLDVNRMTYDPYTQQLYATVPSTATQLPGNSVVSIDPTSGSIGTQLNVVVGSGADPIAESSDGKDLYIGLDGSESITFVDLTTKLQGPVFPVVYTGTLGTKSAARSLAVAPGDDNLLAVDTGSGSGIGLFDISGSTGTMRSHLTGTYTGSDVMFGNASTVYSYDTDTSGEEFWIWTVTSTGLTMNNNTGYTLNGMGGFSGSFALDNGESFGFSGGNYSLGTTPPTQLGEFLVSSAQGSGQTIEGSGVAPDLSLGRAFYLGETLAGTANPVLLSFDSSKYVMLGMQQFTGASEGEDLVRWGRDGLAWHTSSGGGFGSAPGAGQVFLVRGPFVLPEWSTANPTPSIASAPSTIAAGGGNTTLAIVGSNFVPGAVVTWNGAERSTTFIDSSHLGVAIPASDVAQSGTASIAANNPNSANSNSVTIMIN